MNLLEQLQLTGTMLPILPPHFLVWSLMSIVLVLVIGNALFAYSIYKTAKLIPKANHRFPIWLLWFFLIPIVNLIFQVMILVFDIPQSLKRTYRDNLSVTTTATSLFSLGIVFTVLVIVGWYKGGLISLVFSFINLILISIYWVKVVNVRRYCRKS